MTHGNKETFPRLGTPLCDVSVEQALSVVEAIVTVQRDYGDRQNRKHARMKYVVEEQGIAWFRAEVERRLGCTLRDPRPIHLHDVEDHLGWHQQGDGRWYLGLHVVNGRIKDTATQRMKAGLRHAIEQFRPGVRLTGQQNILLTGLSGAQREPLEALLRIWHIHRSARGGLPLCDGLSRAPTCGLSLRSRTRYQVSCSR
jgi:sulfite reductase beta subunit-like hemoprotein